MKFVQFYVYGIHLKNVQKSTHFGCHTALDLKSSLTSHFNVQEKKSIARAWGRLMLPSAPSPFSEEVPAAVRSVSGTPQPVRGRPECWQTDSSQVLLLVFDAIQPCIRKVLSQVTSVCKKIKYLPDDAQSLIGTFTTFTRSWGSSSVRCTDPTTGQTVPEELSERQPPAGVVLPTLWTPSDCRIRATDEPLPDLLVKIVVVPMEALSVH